MDGLKVQEVWRDFPSVLSLGFTVKQLNIHQIHDEDMQLIWDGESGPCTWVLGDTVIPGKPVARDAPIDHLPEPDFLKSS